MGDLQKRFEELYKVKEVKSKPREESGFSWLLRMIGILAGVVYIGWEMYNFIVLKKQLETPNQAYAKALIFMAVLSSLEQLLKRK